MSFLHPLLLGAGLAMVSLPIIIHFLFRRRRKPVRWGAMRFLLEAYRRQRRRLRLEQLLLLAARCALIALIAVGLGRPVLRRAGLLGGGSMTVYLLVDNSIAASATGPEDGSALDRHKRTASALLERLDPSAGDRAGLIALGAPAEAVVMPSSAEIDAVARAVSELEPTAGAMDLDGAMSRLGAELSGRDRGAAPVRVVVLSDFLAGAADTERRLSSLEGVEEAALLATAPATRGADNVAVTALEPLRPVLVTGDGEIVRQRQVRVRLRRSGPGVAGEAVTRVRITQDRPGVEGGTALVGEATARWPAGETRLELPVGVTVVGAEEAGVLTARVDRDAIDADNLFRRPIQVRSRLRVGLAAKRRLGVGADRVPLDAADWIDMALSPEGEQAGEIEVTRIEPAALDAGRLAALDALVLVDPDALEPGAWSRVAQFGTEGGLVIAFPPAGATTHAWTDQMLEAFGLGWSIQREVVRHEDGLGIARQRGPFGAAGDPLALLAGELEALTRPVTIWRRLAVRAQPERGAALMRLDDGSPLVLSAPPRTPGAGDGAGPSRGLVVLIATAPSFEWTDLPARPLIVPLMQELVRQGLGQAHGRSWALAGRTVTAPARATELIGVGNDDRLAVSPDGRVTEPVRRTGLWRALDRRGADRGLVAVNADAAASVAEPQSKAEIQAWLAPAAPASGVTWIEAGTLDGAAGAVEGELRAEEASTALAAKILAAALLIGLAELAMARLFSHARLGPESRGGAT